MLRDIVRRPLEQLLALLWLIGMVNLAGRLLADQLSFGMVFTALLAGLLALHLLVHYRLPGLFFLPVLLGLVALRVFLKIFGVGVSGVMLAQAVYALASWLFLVDVERRGWLNKAVRLLNVKAESATDFDSAKLLAIGQITALLVLVFSVIVQLSGSALLTGQGGHSVLLLLTLCCAMLFFGFGGRDGRPVLQSYLVIGLAVPAVMELVSLILRPFSLATLGSDADSGLFLVLFSIGMCALSYVLAGRPKAQGGYRGVYARSLRTIAVLLALTSFGLQSLQLAWLSALIIRPPDVLIPALAAIALLSANGRLRFAGVDLLAFLLATHALLALDYTVLHFGRPYDLRPGGGYPDQWLLLGGISLLLASIAFRLEARGRAEPYCGALNTASAMAYVWTFLAGIASFGNAPFENGLFHLGISLILIAGQFLLLRDLPNADRIRGITVPLLLLAALCAVLSLMQRTDLLRLSIVVYAFGLFLWARRLLPIINPRRQSLAIYPAYPEWIGLMLVYAALLGGGPVWVLQWPWLLAATLYQLLLRKVWLSLPALLMLALAGLWAQSAWLHAGASFSLWPGAQRFPDIGLGLALASFIYGVLSKWTPGFPALGAFYHKPLRTAGALCGVLAFMGSLPLLPNFSSAIFPWLYLTLFLALFPLSENRDAGALLRDIGGSVLFALTFLCAWELKPHMLPMEGGLLVQGFGLWMIASWIIPAFSRLFPVWGFKPVCWPWLGLLSVLASFPGERMLAPNLTAYFLALSVYGMLMLRYSRLGVFAWLPGTSFTLAGLAAGALAENLFWIAGQDTHFVGLDTHYTWETFPIAFTVNTLAWANLQLLLVKAGRQQGALLAQKLQLQRQDLAKAFENGALLIFGGWLLIYAVRTALAFWHLNSAFGMALHPGTLLFGALLIVSFLHGLLSNFSELRLHGLLLALFLTLAEGYLTYGVGLVLPPMLLALWCLLLAIAEALVSLYHGSYRQNIENALAIWIRLSLAVATLSLLIYPFATLDDVLSSMLPITLITGFQGLWMWRARWLYIACAELLVVLHLWPFLLFDATKAVALLPWYALQLYLLTCLLCLGWFHSEGSQAESNDRLAFCRRIFSFWPLLNALALIELIAHGFGVAYHLRHGLNVLWLSPVWDPAAALAAGMMQFGIGLRYARRAPDSASVYGIVFLIAALGCYFRLIIAGSAPVNLWDTSILIVFAYGLFFMQRIFASKPLLHMAMLTPLAALSTVPLQLQSPEASATLMVTGLLYLWIRRYTQKQLPVYLALLAFNIGLYLWIPGIVKQSHLVQIYVIPAALSILILLQLHRRELKPSVIMATRLAATSSIYACATLDVFLLPDLQVFVLALGLSLAGIILGIALRIRAFLYAGMAFMGLNVLGQLLRFYPDQALGKAIVLMGAGMIILCSMIWFNLKKMQILQRVDLIRGELASWD